MDDRRSKVEVLSLLGALGLLIAALCACKSMSNSADSGNSASPGQCTKVEDCPRGSRCVGGTCVGHAAGVTQAEVDDARAKIVGSWAGDWAAQQNNPNIQKMDAEHRAKAEANVKKTSFVFRADNTVDVNTGEKDIQGTWNMSSAFEGAVGVQILAGDGKGNDNMELKVAFDGPNRMKLDLGAANASFALLRQ
jgi:hypothetical protein